MIKTNFSTTSNLACFINKKCESKAFAQREIVTRIAGLALPLLAFVDVAVHSAGMLESCFKGIAGKQGDFADFHRHAKCVKIFLRLFFVSSFYGALFPTEILKVFEDETVSCVNVLLLSRYPEYSEKCVVDTSKIVKYIKKYVDQMEEEDLLGMEDAPKLLADADKYLSRENLQSLKNETKGNLTHKLTDLIRHLRKAHGSFVKTVLFKQCLARLLCLGLSITCALDLIYEIFFSSFILFTYAMIKLIVNKSIDLHDKKDVLRYVASVFRDHLIHLSGTLTGSVIGLIDPDTAANLTDTHSSWYRKWHFKGERFTESLLEDLAVMKEGETLLIPLSFRTKDSGHIVYCLADRTSNGYNFSTLNTGYGSNYAEMMLKYVTSLKSGLEIGEASKRVVASYADKEEKYLANYTFKNLTYVQVSKHVKTIRELADTSFNTIKKQAKEKKVSPEEHSFSMLYPVSIATDDSKTIPLHGRMNSQGIPDLRQNSQLMFSSPQKIGDCPKSSLLAALNYHSSQQQQQDPNYQPYDKWVRKLQDRVFEKDGYLIDISLNLKNHDRKAREVAKTHLVDRWESYTAKHLAA